MSTSAPSRIEELVDTVVGHYREHGRTGMPWRETDDPYRILVSEVMLQQTQVSRVLPAYLAWIERFPDAPALAAAPLEAVLESWRGLGYNRRAIALKRAAEQVCALHGGTLPRDRDALLALPGVGPATAGGILAFAYREPARYLETNVRTVFIHELFPDSDGVRDREIEPLLDAALEVAASRGIDPRTWYYALMDYGVHLKSVLPNPSRRSAHHARQSPFQGSHRQKRARLLRSVLECPGRTTAELAGDLEIDESLAEEIAVRLEAEGFLAREARGKWRVAG